MIHDYNEEVEAHKIRMKTMEMEAIKTSVNELS